MPALLLRITCVVAIIVASQAFQYLKATRDNNRMTLQMKHERIVVTGLGVISPVGSDPNIYFDNLCNGVSGISKVDRFDPEPFKCQIAGQIRDFDPRAHYKSKKKIKQNDLCTHFAVAASHLALADAGIDLLSSDGKVDATRVGVIVGSAFGGMDSFEKAANDLAQFGPSSVGPYTVRLCMINTIAISQFIGDQISYSTSILSSHRFYILFSFIRCYYCIIYHCHLNYTEFIIIIL